MKFVIVLACFVLALAAAIEEETSDAVPEVTAELSDVSEVADQDNLEQRFGGYRPGFYGGVRPGFGGGYRPGFGGGRRPFYGGYGGYGYGRKRRSTDNAEEEVEVDVTDLDTEEFRGFGGGRRYGGYRGGYGGYRGGYGGQKYGRKRRSTDEETVPDQETEEFFLRHGGFRGGFGGYRGGYGGYGGYGGFRRGGYRGGFYG